MQPNRALISGLLSVLSLATASTASAVIIVDLDVRPVTAADGVCEGYHLWTFSATGTPTDGFLADGSNYITVYDIPGTICTAEPGALFDIQQNLTGRTPAGLTPTDDPSARNFTATYTEPSSRPGSNVLAFPYFLRIFTSIATPAALQYAWQDYSAYPISTGVLQSGLGTVRTATGNGGGDGGSTPVPEPGTLLLVSLGLVAVLSSRRTR